MLIVDSVAALVPMAEHECDMGDAHVGVHARLMSQALRKLAGAISQSNCVAIFINQLREKIGVMYGNPETTTGGRALKFYASVRIDIRKKETLKVGGEMVGSHTLAKVVKNKVAPPFKEAEFDIMYGEGISRESELIDLGDKTGVVKKSGAWFYYGELRLGQGRDNAKQYFVDHPELADEVEEKIMAALRESSNVGKKATKTDAEPAGEVTVAEEPAPVAARPKIDIDVAVDD